MEVIEGRPLLGRLPREENKSAIAIIPMGAAPARPVEVHNIELDAADTNMYGNGGTEVLGTAWGDCVFEMIEEDRVISAKALGVPVTHTTPAQVVRNYCDYNGIPYAASSAPGPGSNILGALKWAQNHPERFGGSKLLFYGDYPITDEGMKQAVAEFGSVCVGVVVYAAMEYPNKVWYTGARGANVGGHGIAGGSYTATDNSIKTWGYQVSINAKGFGTIDELVVCVWDFQWPALPYERQIACIDSYQYVTGKTWTGPQPIKPIIQEVTVPSVIVLFTTMPPRMCDSRALVNVGTAARPLAPGESRVVQIAGLLGIPANATGLVGNLTVTNEAAAGWVSVTPVVPTGSYSSINFPPHDTRANGFIAAIVSGSVVVHNGSLASTDFLIDAPGYLIPA